MTGITIRRFQKPDEARVFDKGRFELIRIGGLTVGRASYEPGWRWSEHVGLVVSGRAMVVMDGGAEVVFGPGDLFSIGSGHDSWVVGDEPYVSLHLLGAVSYATATRGT